MLLEERQALRTVGSAPHGSRIILEVSSHDHVRPTFSSLPPPAVDRPVPGDGASGKDVRRDQRSEKEERVEDEEQGVADPEVREKLKLQYMDVVADTPAEARAWLAADIERWRPIIQKNNITLD